MLQPLKYVGKKYKMLIIKMAANCGSMELVKINILNLCDIDMILGLPCVLPMLEFVNALMKFMEGQDVFVCDYIAIVKICHTNLLP
jgi:hypothetical protein